MDGDDYDADTSPGLIVSALGSPIHHRPYEPAPREESFSSFPPPVSMRPSQARISARIPSEQVLPVSGTLPRMQPAALGGSVATLQLELPQTSLPETPSVFLLPNPATLARPEEPRRALTSILVFAAMLCAAGVPLARYALGSESAKSTVMPRAAASAPLARGAARVVPTPSAPQVAEPAHVDRQAEILAGLPADPQQGSQYLVDHAVRAKDSGELQLAESLLGRAFELDHHNPHPAFALAKLRFEQNNFEGAEGWIATAVRLRPRRPEYRTLYADVLDRLGREHEANDERRRAKRLAE